MWSATPSSFGLGVLLALLAGCRSGPAAEALPAAERLFVAEHPDLPQKWLVGAAGGAGYIAAVPGQLRLKLTGRGIVQAAAYGDIGAGPRVYLAWGRARGALDAPLVLQEVDPVAQTSRELWRHSSPRPDAVHLSVTDVDGDGRDDLAFLYFDSKYYVRGRHVLHRRDGASASAANAHAVLLTEPIRMATSWAFADVDGDGLVDWVVGRPYGDTKESVGDLRIRSRGVWSTIPTDKGVRSLVVDPRDNSIWFADGWHKSYARKARAQLKHVRLPAGQVRLMGTSADEYTFNEIVVLGDKLAVLGDKRWSSLVDGGLRDTGWGPLATVTQVGGRVLGYQVGDTVRPKRLSLR